MYTNKDIVLITQYYESTNSYRQVEIDSCLLRNYMNPFISQMFVFMDEEIDLFHVVPPSDSIKRVIRRSSVGNMRYGEAFNFCNRFLSDKICILANSDIFFDESLKHLHFIDFSKTALALSRHEMHTDPSGNIEWKLCDGPDVSQDAWVLVPPMRVAVDPEIELGIIGCDNVIAAELKRGYTVINPCNTIKCFHNHLSEHRTYNDLKDYKRNRPAAKVSVYSFQ